MKILSKKQYWLFITIIFSIIFSQQSKSVPNEQQTLETELIRLIRTKQKLSDQESMINNQRHKLLNLPLDLKLYPQLESKLYDLNSEGLLLQFRQRDMSNKEHTIEHRLAQLKAETNPSDKNAAKKFASYINVEFKNHAKELERLINNLSHEIDDLNKYDLPLATRLGYEQKIREKIRKKGLKLENIKQKLATLPTQQRAEIMKHKVLESIIANNISNTLHGYLPKKIQPYMSPRTVGLATLGLGMAGISYSAYKIRNYWRDYWKRKAEEEKKEKNKKDEE